MWSCTGPTSTSRGGSTGWRRASRGAHGAACGTTRETTGRRVRCTPRTPSRSSRSSRCRPTPAPPDAGPLPLLQMPTHSDVPCEPRSTHGSRDRVPGTWNAGLRWRKGCQPQSPGPEGCDLVAPLSVVRVGAPGTVPLGRLRPGRSSTRRCPGPSPSKHGPPGVGTGVGRRRRRNGTKTRPSGGREVGTQDRREDFSSDVRQGAQRLVNHLHTL